MAGVQGQLAVKSRFFEMLMVHMYPKFSPDYLAAYPVALVTQARALIVQNKLAEYLLLKYPVAHQVRNDRALYVYIQEIKEQYLRNTGALSRVAFDSTLHVTKNALGLHTRVARVQGIRLKVKREIRVAEVFKDMPAEFLRMIVVHELAHLKSPEHNKAFYQLCLNMEPDYHQLEFELRVYLCYLEGGGLPLWANEPAAPQAWPVHPH